MNKTLTENKSFIIIGLIIFTLQLVLDNLNAFGLVDTTKTWLAATLMLIGAITSVYTQYRDKQMPTISLGITAAVILVGLSGAILESIDKIPFPENIASGLRLTLTLIVRVVPVWVKALSGQNLPNLK